MGKINVDDLRPGMVVASDLYGPNERFLLAAETVLAEKHLQTLKAWGVTEADIHDISKSEVEERSYARFDQDCIERARQRVGERFVLADQEHEAVAELYRLAVLREAEGLENEPEAGDTDIGPKETVPAQQFAETLPPLEMTDVIRENIQFASLPSTFMKISEAINDPQSSSRYIAQILSADISLSTKLLQLVNSAFYGFPQKIGSLAQAVTIIGTRQLVSLAQGVSLISHFSKIPSIIVDMEAFWKHSICCGIIARLISSGQKKGNADSLWMAGLLHDIGRLVLLQGIPTMSVKFLRGRAGIP